MDELQANCRPSIVELAQRVNLTKTLCSEQVRRLEISVAISAHERDVMDALGLKLLHGCPGGVRGFEQTTTCKQQIP